MTSQLLINEPPLQVLPSLARVIGLNEAIVLQQVHYWLNPNFNKNVFEGRHWVHNTFTQWQQQFAFWSKKTIKRTIGGLEDSGLLVSFVTRNFKKTKYYTVNYDLLNCLTILDANTSLKTQAGCVPGHDEGKDCSEALENQRSHLWGQHDPLEEDTMTLSKGTTCPSRRGQLDPLDGVNVTPFHYTETTPENTSENTLPPLPVFCPSSARQGQRETIEDGFTERQEEEEQENKNKKITNAKQPIQHQLLELWNQTVQSKIYSGQEVRLTEKREKLIFTFLATVWGEKSDAAKLQCWQDYCALIAQSRFLAGHNTRGFKVTLDWALIPDNAYKVLEGAIYDKPEPVEKQFKDQSWEEFAEELARTLPSSPYLQPWLKISVNLAKMIGQLKYRSWFFRVTLKELTEPKAIFSVEGEFARDYIVSHFSSEIRCAIQSLYPQVKHIDFQACSSNIRNLSFAGDFV